MEEGGVVPYLRRERGCTVHQVYASTGEGAAVGGWSSRAVLLLVREVVPWLGS
jgi:hypothetical protein